VVVSPIPINVIDFVRTVSRKPVMRTSNNVVQQHLFTI
tara:strand:- start:717 stop:830 length:114 start_codon:yes stop_codon:yes gene_type:complete